MPAAKNKLRDMALTRLLQRTRKLRFLTAERRT